MRVEDYINQHEYVKYCECIIYPNGDIEDAEHGHTNKIKDATGKTREELNEFIPLIASPMLYLVGYTKCILVSYEFFIYETISDEQLHTIQELVNADILRDGIFGYYTDEYERCNLLVQFEKGEIDESKLLRERKKKNINIFKEK